MVDRVIEIRLTTIVQPQLCLSGKLCNYLLSFANPRTLDHELVLKEFIFEDLHLARHYCLSFEHRAFLRASGA